jgi:replicative DNA helicase
MEDNKLQKYRINSHLIDFFNGMEKEMEKEDPYSPSGLETGFDYFDCLTSGLQAATLIIVAGRPSMGKTTFAMNIAKHTAVKMKKPCIIFTFETSPLSLTKSFLKSCGSIRTRHLKATTLDEIERAKLTEAVHQLSDSPLYIRDALGDNIDDICKNAHAMTKDIGDIALIVIDYLQLLCLSGFTPENRTAELSAITRRLKILAKELNVPIIVVSQLNRSVENRMEKRPQMNDLRDSGTIEDDADLVCLMHKVPYYADNENWSLDLQVTEINIIKHRGGPTGSFLLSLSKEHNRFSEFSHAQMNTK